MTTTTPEVTTCPAWCTGHPENETEVHQSATWRTNGLSIVIEQDDKGLSVEVDKAGGSEYLSLSPEQAHELGLELVRASARVRPKLAADALAAAEWLEGRTK